MARVPVESGVRAEALQTVAMPKVQAVTARFDPNESSAFQLATALGAAGPQIDRFNRMAAQAVQTDAQQFANSMTPDELRKKIDSGEIPMWKSPLWAATVQNVAGGNSVKAIFRDVDSKIAMGEFKTQEELDAYIQSKRNEALSGKSNYEVTGFDKQYAQYRDRAANQQNVVITKRLETEGLQVATEDLSNATSEITGEAFNGKSAQDKVQYILQKYNQHRTARTLNDDSAKKALDGVILSLAATGNVELVNEFAKTRLPNNGPTVEAFLSPQRILQLRNTAETQYGQNVRAAEKAAVQAQQAQIVGQASLQARELVAQRNGASMTDVVVPTEDGGTKVLKGSDFTEAAVQEQMTANPDMPFDEQVRLYKNNGVINQQWKREFSTAVYNLGEITIDADGKPSGTLLKGTTEQLEKFSIARQVSEQYAKDLVGEDNYKILNKVQALREAGIPEVAQAAGIVNQINRRQYEPQTWGKIQKDVSASIEDIKNPGIFTGRFWSELFRGEFGSGDKNIIPIEGNIRELAEAYVQARITPDAKTAVKMASDYMSKSVVQVNNTMYMRSDLPKVPQGEDDVKWFEKYQKEVLIPRLKKMGIDPSLGDLTLLPQKGGQAMFTVTNRGMPLPREGEVGIMSITNAEIESWVKSQLNSRSAEAATKANQELERKQRPASPPKATEIPGGAVLIAPRGTRKRSE
jgi:hypothetical protein